MSEVKERPILFSTPMVRAVLDDRKTKTRRTLKPAMVEAIETYLGGDNETELAFAYLDNVKDEGGSKAPVGWYVWCAEYPEEGVFPIGQCPYGKVGDRLWVREEHKIWQYKQVGNQCETWVCEYRDGTVIEKYAKEIPLATVQKLRKRKTLGKWQRARFLPKAFCRILLEITDIRVERLQDIFEEDAIAEGVEIHSSNRLFNFYKSYTPDRVCFNNPIDSFRTLWQSINGLESWAANPWVPVISFRRVEA